MPRGMPPLASRFAREVDRALSLPRAGELIHDNSPPGSVARSQMRPSRLEALYEMAYLRVFTAWESFLEESFLRYLCGYATRLGVSALLQPACKSLADAKIAALAGRHYVSWADPGDVARRGRRLINNGQHESVMMSNTARLEWLAFVRHRVAHRSEYSRFRFDTATMNLAGRRYRGALPGAFLRDWNPGAIPAERWLHALSRELESLAFQIVP